MRRRLRIVRKLSRRRQCRALLVIMRRVVITGRPRKAQRLARQQVPRQAQRLARRQVLRQARRLVAQRLVALRLQSRLLRLPLLRNFAQA